MIVGFSRYGTGKGSGAVDYLTADKDKDGVSRKVLPEVIRGDSDRTQKQIDSLDFKYKYTSGVLSFAPGEIITPEMEENIINEFETAAFAGLEEDQYNTLWVRHAHADHHELHFVVPRVELSTGKSLNIAPPGKVSRELFDTFRSKINAEYGLADPDDPSRAKDISLPDHIARIKAKEGRTATEKKADIREVINGYVRERVDNGVIKNRDDVVTALKEAGFKIPREGKNYITVEDSETGDKYRMKGSLYDKEDFNSVKNISFPKEEAKPNPEKAAKLQLKLNRLTDARGKYNREYYGEPDNEEVKEVEKMSLSESKKN